MDDGLCAESSHLDYRQAAIITGRCWWIKEHKKTLRCSACGEPAKAGKMIGGKCRKCSKVKNIQKINVERRWTLNTVSKHIEKLSKKRCGK